MSIIHFSFFCNFFSVKIIIIILRKKTKIVNGINFCIVYFRKKSSFWRNVKELLIYNCVKLYIIMYEQIFLHFSKFDFF